MSRNVILYLFVTILSSGSYTAYGQTGRHARTVITEHINERKLVGLHGNIRPEANTANDRGPVADDFQMNHLFLQLKRSLPSRHWS